MTDIIPVYLSYYKINKTKKDGDYRYMPVFNKYRQLLPGDMIMCNELLESNGQIYSDYIQYNRYMKICISCKKKYITVINFEGCNIEEIYYLDLYDHINTYANEHGQSIINKISGYSIIDTSDLSETNMYATLLLNHYNYIYDLRRKKYVKNNIFYKIRNCKLFRPSGKNLLNIASHIVFDKEEG